MRISRRKIVAAGAAVVSLAVAAGAYAFWTTSGAGTGTASAASSVAVTVAQVGTTAGLYPGGPAQNIDFKINNPGPSTQYIGTVVVSITGVTSGPAVGAAACTAGDFTLTQPAAINADLAVGDTTYLANGSTLLLKNLAVNQDGCKAATVALGFSAS
ncbi:MAG: hypothetical protein ACRD1K_02360 [Acidimicrobiales bacterium]